MTRAAAADLFKSIIKKSGDTADAKYALDELLSLPKSGKTSGAEHRISLYIMLGHLSPATEISPVIIQSIPPLLTKETHDAAISVLVTSLTPHVVFALRENSPLPAEASTLTAKGMNDAKPSIRRAFCSLVGNSLWQLEELSTQASSDFVRAILPSIETNLKTITANPASAPAGPLEGYIAVATLLGPIHRSGKFGKRGFGSSPRALTDIEYRRVDNPECQHTRAVGNWLQTVVSSVG